MSNIKEQKISSSEHQQFIGQTQMSQDSTLLLSMVHFKGIKT
jgi:hypothetical protein